MHEEPLLLVRNHDISTVNRLDHVVWRLPIDGASHGLSGAEDLLHAASKVLRERFVRHLSGDLGGGRMLCVSVGENGGR